MIIKQKLLNLIRDGFFDKNGWHNLELKFLMDREGSGEIHYGVRINCHNHFGKRAGKIDTFCENWSDKSFEDALYELDWENRKKCSWINNNNWN